MDTLSVKDLISQHHPLPFAHVPVAEILPALREALTLARENILRLLQTAGPATVQNTLLPLEACDEGADRIASLYYHLLNADGTPELRKRPGSDLMAGGRILC